MNEASRAFSITASTVKLDNGISLPVAEHGANGGTPLLFLHGYPDSWRSFAHVLPLLPPSIRAIVPTQRGYGDADKPADGYAIRDLADDAVKILDKLGIERTFIAGHSMGSMVAQRIAIDSPERVMGLVLIGSAPASRGNAGLEELWQTTVSTLEGPISRDFAFEFQSSTLGQPIPSQLLDTIVDESLKVPVHVWKEALHKLLEVDHTDDLSRIDIERDACHRFDSSVVARKQIAERARQRAEDSEQRAAAQRNTARAQIYQVRPGELYTSTLLAVASYTKLPSEDAEEILRKNISLLPLPVEQMTHTAAINSLEFNAAGDVFTFDSDTEFEIGLPWYRPTRVFHCPSGADLGWRPGALKVPAGAPDTSYDRPTGGALRLPAGTAVPRSPWRTSRDLPESAHAGCCGRLPSSGSISIRSVLLESSYETSRSVTPLEA